MNYYLCQNMEAKRLSFSKSEKLCSKKIIEAIYTDGQKLKQFPFILNYLEVPDDFTMAAPVQIVTAVPKRRVKLASSRNRLKRQIREAYRLNKTALIEAAEASGKNLALFLIYIGKETENYTFIETKLSQLLTELQNKIEKK